MNTSRTLRALAVVPVLGALALGPAAAFADQGAHYRENTAGARHERSTDVRQLLDTSLADDEGMLDAHRGAKGTLAHSSSTLAHSELMRGMFTDHGKHRGWFAKNDATSTWGSQIFTSIKDDSFKNFMTAASNTPLGASDRKSTRLNSSHPRLSRMPSSA